MVLHNWVRAMEWPVLYAHLNREENVLGYSVELYMAMGASLILLQNLRPSSLKHWCYYFPEIGKWFAFSYIPCHIYSRQIYCLLTVMALFRRENLTPFFLYIHFFPAQVRQGVNYSSYINFLIKFVSFLLIYLLSSYDTKWR